MAPAFQHPPDMRLGSSDSAGTGGPVARLQAELRRLQVLQPGEPVVDGVFDGNTAAAVRRFQWFAGRVPGALSAAGEFVVRPLTRLKVDGVVGTRTRRLVQAFLHNGWTATGLLVQLRFDLLDNTHPNIGFSALIDGNADVGVCEGEFAAVLAAMDAAARRLGIFVFVNQLFRVEGGALQGAIAPPASFSAHRIGRAVDLQLGTAATPIAGSNPQPAVDIMSAGTGTPFASFRDHAKLALKCRYGGDFDPADPPHFDRQIRLAGAQAWNMHYFFNQLQYRQALANSRAIPSAIPGAIPSAIPGADGCVSPSPHAA